MIKLQKSMLFANVRAENETEKVILAVCMQRTGRETE